jgi:hypothetical protein
MVGVDDGWVRALAVLHAADSASRQDPTLIFPALSPL